ncbi:hypothetical protein CFOL_v3_34097 [Cephalotus follicularis]|uniref:Uncharacterized protein n=1 Tax=Cephalotus follicularis TaxID=3775 RepID=A0A1Q3DE27_CEPFO|nr:hypothetical protein CFOL_v3_34097 [Cephalotus follicularis]
MFLSAKVAAQSLYIPVLHHVGFNELSCLRMFGVSKRFYLNNLETPLYHRHYPPRLHSINNHHDNNTAHDISDPQNCSINPGEKSEDSQGNSVGSTEMWQRLCRYGTSGILSYGLLNTAYYFMTFLLVWFYVAPAPGKMGYMVAVERFLKVMAMVWAGSQVTKLVRAGWALALAPFVDRGLSWFTVKFNFETQRKAFIAIVGFCFGLAIVLFFVVTLLSA